MSQLKIISAIFRKLKATFYLILTAFALNHKLLCAVGDADGNLVSRKSTCTRSLARASTLKHTHTRFTDKCLKTNFICSCLIL